MQAAAQAAGDLLWDASWTEAAGEQTIKERSACRPGASDGAQGIDFFCSWFCPFAQRAWIALEELRLPYTYIEINPYAVDASQPGGYTKKQLSMREKTELYPDFVRVSPRGLVPALSDCGIGVFESLPLIEYLDEVYGTSERRLMPRNAYQRAQVRIWCDYVTNRIQKAYYVILISQNTKQQNEAYQTLLNESRMLARAMELNSAAFGSGPFFLGLEFSMMDIALAPFWFRFLVIGGHYRNLTFPEHEPEFVRLRVWWEAVRARPCVARTLVCEPRLIESYRQYARNEATSDFAQGMRSSIRDADTK
ncbi:putative glutathione S-transferase parC [Porphyridium purpureum]|uniref:Putative glutathione S-transferase parC n=1 Tax=Porphyridium purpureum TaxID=35688 RepID=A0A5J4YKS2_PORPP|nr:putative glutathione S-transferase parC [Porphyridium purpureum]|eukprot:POR8249..scf291_13